MDSHLGTEGVCRKTNESSNNLFKLESRSQCTLQIKMSKILRNLFSNLEQSLIKQRQTHSNCLFPSSNSNPSGRREVNHFVFIGNEEKPEGSATWNLASCGLGYGNLSSLPSLLDHIQCTWTFL